MKLVLIGTACHITINLQKIKNPPTEKLLECTEKALEWKTLRV